MNILYFRSFIVFLFFSLQGCSVAPWERGNLAKKNMAITVNSGLSALRDHAFTSKEASQGGYGGAGGGCGCN